MALRITQQGLEAVEVKEDTVDASTETPIGAAAAPQVETSATEAVFFRKRMSAVVQKPARKKQQLRTAKTKAASSRESRPGSKQARVLAMLGRPEGATIGAIIRATHWQQHSVRGFFAAVVRKKLRLDLRSEKADGARVYRIVPLRTARSESRPSRRRAV